MKYNGNIYPILTDEEFHNEHHVKNHILAVGCIFCESEINKTLYFIFSIKGKK